MNIQGGFKPWQRRQWCFPEIGAAFVCAMEDVLEVYAQPYDARRPVVCFDEMPVQLVGEARVPQPAAPGRPARHDDEFRRNGTANLFGHAEPQAGRRRIAVTARRTKVDFAAQMQALVDEHYPEATVIRVVLDHLNTHKPAALYEAFPPAEARRVLRRLAACRREGFPADFALPPG